MGRALVTSVCLFVRAVKEKLLELSTPNLIRIYCIVVARHALTQRSKGEGHMVTKSVTVAWMLVMYAATAVCCCCWRKSAYRYDYLCYLVIIGRVNAYEFACLIWASEL